MTGVVCTVVRVRTAVRSRQQTMVATVKVNVERVRTIAAVTLWHVLIRRRKGERLPGLGGPCSGHGGTPQMKAKGGTRKSVKDLNGCRGRGMRGP